MDFGGKNHYSVVDCHYGYYARQFTQKDFELSCPFASVEVKTVNEDFLK